MNSRDARSLPEEKTFLATKDFGEDYPGVLRGKKGDKFLFLEERPHWWWMRALSTNKEGYVRPENMEPFQPHSAPPIPPTRPPKPDRVELPPEIPKRTYSTDSSGNSPSWKPPRGSTSSESGPSPRRTNMEDLIPRPVPPPLMTVPKKTNYATPIKDTSGDSWFFGKIPTNECEKLLKRQGNGNGTFMVRESTNERGRHRLSILYMGKVHHYCIEKHKRSGYFFRDIGILFRDLERLVHYYCAVQDDLCCKPTTPCTKLEPDVWEIKRNELKTLKEIGKGNFGRVFKGKWMMGSRDVAIKQIRLKDLKSEEDFMQEANAMKQLRHPNIVFLYGLVYGDPALIVTEFMTNGNLKTYLDKGRGMSCNTNDHLDISFQIATGMAYMEEKNYVHRDLRADNILVGEDLLCKIADFGLARILDDSVYKFTCRKLPLKWTAPEAITHLDFSSKSDVWSFGVLLYEIFTNGSEPYEDFHHPKDVLTQVERGYRMTQPRICPDDVYEIMLSCWNLSPEGRPMFSSLQERLEKASYPKQ